MKMCMTIFISQKMIQGDIVLIPFPFSDLSAHKTRPALVLNSKAIAGGDVIVCAISSKRHMQSEISISSEDLAWGELPLRSYVKPYKIVTLNSRIIKKRVATLRKEKLKIILAELKKYLT